VLFGMVHYTEEWFQTSEGKQMIATDVVFLDFSKTFDSVPHEPLLYKVEQHTAGGSLK
jgi:hypothetical protein